MSISLEVTQIKRKQSCDAELKFFPQFFPLKDLFWKTVGKHIKQEATVLKNCRSKVPIELFIMYFDFLR